MPHQCVRCNKFHDDGAKEILQGCECGGRLFFFVKKNDLQKAKDISEHTNKEDKILIENEIFELIGKDSCEETVVLDFEAINIPSHGKYELDLVKLFKKEPLVYKVGEGKYMIDIPHNMGILNETSQKVKKHKKK